MTTFANERELADAMRQQDPLTVSHMETRTTDVETWLRNLAMDVEAGAIVDPAVYLSVRNGLATLNDVKERRVIGGDREIETFRRRGVEASYIRYETVQKLSVYCGVICVTIAEDAGIAANQRAINELTAKRITETLRKVQVGLSKYKQLKVHSGMALHLHSVTETWSAGPEDAIEVPPTWTCVECGVELHWANKRWRDEKAQYEVLIGKRHGHFHRPEGSVLDEDGNEVGS